MIGIDLMLICGIMFGIMINTYLLIYYRLFEKEHTQVTHYPTIPPAPRPIVPSLPPEYAKPIYPLPSTHLYKVNDDPITDASYR